MARRNLHINDEIRAPRVRLVDAEGEQLGVMSLEDALQRARAAELDLVEVAPESDPPVCRVMDYGKFKYHQQKRHAESRKRSSRVELKEVKLRPRTDPHDLQTKVGQARRFLEDNNKVKFSVNFRGRELTHPELGRHLLDEIIVQLADVSRVERPPRLEGRAMTVYLSPT